MKSTLSLAADPADDLWNKMFQVMYVGPQLDKASQLERLKSKGGTSEAAAYGKSGGR